jgi:hypothetical protein
MSVFDKLPLAALVTLIYFPSATLPLEPFELNDDYGLEDQEKKKTEKNFGNYFPKPYFTYNYPSPTNSNSPQKIYSFIFLPFFHIVPFSLMSSKCLSPTPPSALVDVEDLAEHHFYSSFDMLESSLESQQDRMVKKNEKKPLNSLSEFEIIDYFERMTNYIMIHSCPCSASSSIKHNDSHSEYMCEVSKKLVKTKMQLLKQENLKNEVYMIVVSICHRCHSCGECSVHTILCGCRCPCHSLPTYTEHNDLFLENNNENSDYKGGNTKNITSPFNTCSPYWDVFRIVSIKRKPISSSEWSPTKPQLSSLPSKIYTLGFYKNQPVLMSPTNQTCVAKFCVDHPVLLTTYHSHSIDLISEMSKSCGCLSDYDNKEKNLEKKDDFFLYIYSIYSCELSSFGEDKFLATDLFNLYLQKLLLDNMFLNFILNLTIY